MVETPKRCPINGCTFHGQAFRRHCMRGRHKLPLIVFETLMTFMRVFGLAFQTVLQINGDVYTFINPDTLQELCILRADAGPNPEVGPSSDEAEQPVGDVGGHNISEESVDVQQEPEVYAPPRLLSPIPSPAPVAVSVTPKILKHRPGTAKFHLQNDGLATCIHEQAPYVTEFRQELTRGEGATLSGKTLQGYRAVRKLLNALVVTAGVVGPIDWATLLTPTNLRNTLDHYVGCGMKGASLIPYLLYLTKFAAFLRCFAAISADTKDQLEYTVTAYKHLSSVRGREEGPGKRRHYHRKCHFIREIVEHENVKVEHCSSEQMKADYLTKCVDRNNLKNCIMGQLI